MVPRALLFPNTVLRPSFVRLLAPLFKPLMVIEPPFLSSAAYSPALLEGGLIQVLQPPAPGDAQAQQGKMRQVAELARQWRQWADISRGTAQAEALKAGFRLPEEEETLGQIRQEIRQGQPLAKDEAPVPPEVRGELILYLAHSRDLEAAQIEGLLERVDEGGLRLDEVIGLTQEDSEPTDYHKAGARQLPPLSHSLPEDYMLPERLAAWSALAGEVETSRAWLASGSQAAAKLLMDWANQRLTPPEDQGGRSATGASEVGASLPPDPGLPWAQEVGRLEVPDLNLLEDPELAGLCQRMEADGGLDRLRGEMAGLLERLSSQTWSDQLAQETARACQDLGQSLTGLAAQAGLAPAAGTKALSLKAFPGLDSAGLRKLMNGPGQADLPPLAAWPHDWPSGSCPLLVAS